MHATEKVCTCTGLQYSLRACVCMERRCMWGILFKTLWEGPGHTTKNAQTHTTDQSFSQTARALPSHSGTSNSARSEHSLGREAAPQTVPEPLSATAPALKQHRPVRIVLVSIMIPLTSQVCILVLSHSTIRRVSRIQTKYSQYCID